MIDYFLTGYIFIIGIVIGLLLKFRMVDKNKGPKFSDIILSKYSKFYSHTKNYPTIEEFNYIVMKLKEELE